MIKDLNPENTDPNANPKEFSVKITADSEYFPWERIASPAFPEGTLRPELYVEYSLTSTLPKPDLTVYESSIETDPFYPEPLSEVMALASIRNTGGLTAYEVQVDFYDGDPGSGGVYLGCDVIKEIPGGGTFATASVALLAAPGRHDIHVVVDPEGGISETDEDNNTAAATIPVLDGYAFYGEGFELGFGDWIHDFDVPKVYSSGRKRLNLMQITRNEKYDGKQSLYAFLDGTGDDGTVWIERSVPVPRYTNVDVTLSFAFGKQVDLATSIVHFIDIYDPEVEVDFTKTGMENGWNVYTFTRSFNTQDRNRVFLAAGFSASWETVIHKYLDSFKVSVKIPDNN